MRHAFCALLLLATGSSSQLDTGECVGKDSFTPLSFDEATLVRSNLGGMGGRCWLDIGNSTGLCADDTAPSATSPRELYFSTLGADRITGDKIDLRITNLTEYRWWSKKWNGIKRIEVDGTVGYFGAVNLRGPRSLSQSGDTWDSEFTMVELKYEFVNQRTSDPYVIDRTYMSFYDFDTGEAKFAGSETQVEVMQMDPAATSLMRRGLRICIHVYVNQAQGGGENSRADGQGDRTSLSKTNRARCAHAHRCTDARTGTIRSRTGASRA